MALKTFAAIHVGSGEVYLKIFELSRKNGLHVIDYARSHDYYNVTLNVWSCNPSAMKFYEAMGLKQQKIGMEMIIQ